MAIHPTVIISCLQGETIEASLDADALLEKGKITIYNDKKKPIVRVDFDAHRFFSQIEALRNKKYGPVK